MLRARHRLMPVVVAAWLPLLLFAAIWIYTNSVPNPFMPPLQNVILELFRFWLGEGFVQHVIPSLRNAAVGFAIALTLGVGLGTVSATFPVVDLLLNPVITFFRALPPLVLLPLVFVFSGNSDVGRIALIVYGALWPILLNTVDGIRAIAPEVLQTARSYRVTRANTLIRVIFPGAYAQISVGIRLSLTISLVLMVASEFYGALQGIGAMIFEAKNLFFTAQMWSGVILLGLIGYLISVLYQRLEDRLLRWRP
jgi:ABC-type nitrate/sulfonate/bicarbonate transport system permease component